MILLSVQHVTKHFGPEPVLDGVTFDVRPGERIGLVGPNGAGKTTLLKIVAGQEEPDGGSALRHPSAHVMILEQQPQFDPARTVWDEAKAALDELVALAGRAETVAEKLSAATDAAQRKRLGDEFDRLQHELSRHDAYNLDYKIERVLAGLGFDTEGFTQPVGTLSGGQQNRLLLAKLLLAEPELMLLDEPSNHLDVAATEWLENYLAECNEAMIVVSHDRYFLDKVTGRTLELFAGTVDSYTGNFSAYWRQKAERLEVQRRTFEKQQTEIAKTEDFIRRNHHGLKHAQAEDRRKKLERVRRESAPPPREIQAPPMGLPPAARAGDIVLRAEGLTKAFAEPLFSDLTFEVARGERWGILGPNGSGKTTLLRCLVGELTADAGRVVVGHGVELGYFDQMLRSVDDAAAVVDAVRPPRREMLEPERRNLLARFGITDDTVFQNVGSLSGGERTRAALARLAALQANVLMLDEPTNHLDLWALDALEQSLLAFDGTLVFVSHDRYFLNRVADHLLVVEPDRFRVVEGNYDTYLHWQRVQQSAAARASEKHAARTPNRTQPRGAKTESASSRRPKRRFPYRKVADLEEEIFQLETRLEALEASLADPQVYRVPGKAREVNAEIASTRESLGSLYEHWEEATEMN